jgi:hypothetical protein
MSAFKKAESGYTVKANSTNHDVVKTAKVDQSLSKKPIEGKGTPNLTKYKDKYLASLKK